MRILLLSLFAVSQLLPVLTQWELFTSYDGRFSVMVPGEMESRTNSIETEIGTIEYHSFIHQSEAKDSDNLVYMISYCDYPEGSVHSDSLELLDDFFKTSIETAATSVEGELLYATDIALNTYPGRLWRIDYNDGQAVIKTKSFLVRSRYYSIQAITVKDRSLNNEMDDFFDSFKLLEK